MTATSTAVDAYGTREVRAGAVLAVLSVAAFLASLELFPGDSPRERMNPLHARG